MTAIPDLSALGLTPTVTPTAPGSTQDTFLTLMLTQLQNQDPMQPLESGEFLSQLAAFETAAGVSALQSSLEKMNASLYETQALQAASLIGHDVLTEVASATLGAEGSVEGFVQLEQSASPLVVEVKDQNGVVVRHIELGSRNPGRVNFEWDGTDDAGNRLPPGEYQLSCNVATEDGAVAARIMMAAEVQSVSLDGYDILLNLTDGSQIAFSQVNEIL